jgi:hypothetical protein
MIHERECIEDGCNEIVEVGCWGPPPYCEDHQKPPPEIDLGSMTKFAFPIINEVEPESISSELISLIPGEEK